MGGGDVGAVYRISKMNIRFYGSFSERNARCRLCVLDG